MRPARHERSEFESIRHGATTLIADFAAVTSVVGYRLRPTCTEEDFACYLAGLLATCSPQTVLGLVMDNLSIPLSEAVVRLVVDAASSSRWPRPSSSCATSPPHCIVLQFVAKQASRLNPVEMWFSILARKVIRRGHVALTLRATAGLGARGFDSALRQALQDRPILRLALVLAIVEEQQR